MRRWPAIIAALALGFLTAPASSQTYTTATAGGWNAFGGRMQASGRGTCGVDTGHAATGRHFLIPYVEGDQGLSVRLLKESWNIPRDTRVPVVIQIDGRPGWRATAVGLNREVRWSIGQDTMDEFERSFRRGLNMRIEFLSGTEPAWNFSLVGTNAVTTAFVDCMRALGGRSSTQPFSATPSRPTQPFSATPPQPGPTKPAW